MDFPEQMAAINRCYVGHIQSGKPPAPDPWPDKEFWTCMEAQGFRFCGDCQIFRYSGGACRNDKNNGPDRPTCWRPVGKNAKAPVAFPDPYNQKFNAGTLPPAGLIPGPALPPGTTVDTKPAAPPQQELDQHGLVPMDRPEFKF
jgi:hypothetical protein